MVAPLMALPATAGSGPGNGTTAPGRGAAHRGRRIGFAAALVVLFALAVGLRAGAALVSSVPPQSDMREYDRIATAALGGDAGPPPVLVRPPGYPLFLAGIYRAFGHRYHPAYLAQAILGGVTCLLLVGAARALRQPRWIALGVGLAVAVSGDLAGYSALLLSENLFLPLAAAAVWLLLHSDAREPGTAEARALAAAGAMLGLSLAVRSAGIFLLAAAVVWAGWRRGSARERLVAVSSLVGGCLAAWLAVAAAGWWVWGEWVPLDPHSGWNLWMGNNPAATGTYYNPPGIRPGGLPEVIRFVLDRPLQFLGLVGRRFLLLWSWQSNDLAIFVRGSWPEGREVWLDLGSFCLAGGLAAIASIAGFGTRRIRLLILAVAMASAMLSLTFVLPRFRNGLLPFLWLLGGCGLAVLCDAFRRGAGEGLRRAAVGLPVAGLLLLLSAAASPWGPMELLSGNADQGPPNPRIRVLLDGPGGPDPAPEMHPSGRGTPDTELIDGLRTGTGDPTWECLLWKGPQPYIGFRGRVVFDLGEIARIDRVTAYSVSPYGDYRIDRLDLYLSQDGAFFEHAGFVVNDRPQARADAFPLRIDAGGGVARYVQFVLRQHNGSGTAMPLCEVRIYGRRMMISREDPNRR